jgi:hypothetical protein
MPDATTLFGRPGAGPTAPISEDDAWEIFRGIVSALAMSAAAFGCWLGTLVDWRALASWLGS